MQKPDFTAEQDFIIVISIVIAIALFGYYKKIESFIDNVLLHWFSIALYILVIIFILIIAVIIFKIAYYKITALIKERNRIKNEAIETENLLTEKLKLNEQILTNDIERIKQKINSCKYNKKLFCFIPELKKRLAKANELLEELEKHKRAKELEERNRRLKEENEELENQHRLKLIWKEDEKQAILYQFDMKNENVFLKEDLTEKEIQALTENGYYSVSEYCIITKKYLNVIIKPCLKHSPTHIFLVWNLKDYLGRIKGIENIQEHLTADADLTFKYQGKIYALEIETGTLLEKKKQIAEKLNYLNEKYPKGWMFIVSNKNLYSKYRKLGLTTTRNQAAEKLAKLLENAHPF